MVVVGVNSQHQKGAHQSQHSQDTAGAPHRRGWGWAPVRWCQRCGGGVAVHDRVRHPVLVWDQYCVNGRRSRGATVVRVLRKRCVGRVVKAAAPGPPPRAGRGACGADSLVQERRRAGASAIYLRKGLTFTVTFSVVRRDAEVLDIIFILVVAAVEQVFVAI